MKNLETLIHELCPDGVEFVKLAQHCKIYDGTHQTPKYQKTGIPFISVENIKSIYDSKKYISQEAYDAYKIKPKVGDVFMTRIGSIGACAVFTKEADIAYYVSLALLRPDSKVLNSGFLKYIIESSWGKKELRKRTLVNAVPIKVNKQDIGKIEIPLPPIEVQTEIVRILDKFTSLEAELDCRKRQYEYYRDKLLSFDNVGGQEVEWKKMSEVCLKTSKINWKLVEGEYKYIDLSSVDRDNHKISDFTIINKENAPSRAQQVVKTGDILFGTTRPTLMRFCYIPKEYDGEVCSTGYCVIRVNNEMINSHFAYHFLFTQKFQDYVEGHQKGASYPAISNKDVMSFELPIPSLQEQERIATILDRFESLTTSLQSGLPAEIAARRQQYEHYRDKLLTFKRKGAA